MRPLPVLPQGFLPLWEPCVHLLCSHDVRKEQCYWMPRHVWCLLVLCGCSLHPCFSNWQLWL